jgi:hypothetical protein
MLNQEQAQAELKKLENKQWLAGRVSGLEALPQELRDTARTLLGGEDETYLQKRARLAGRRDAVADTLEKLDEAERLKMFEAMAPGLGKVIEGGWKLFDRLPYQRGYARKPFRAPGHPEALLGRRVSWLLDLLGVIGPYHQKIVWFAAWAPHLAHYHSADSLGILLAAAIESGGSEAEEVFQILCASGRNEHEIGGMGRHVTRALLCASRPDGWEFVENMLLAAQREEGLRQVILETADEAHPQAFRRMLKLVLDKNLTRFSSTVRAFDVWLGYQWDSVSADAVNQTLEKLLLYFEDPAARQTALKGKDAEEVYLALWTHAFEDAVEVIEPAAKLLGHPRAEHRFVAAHLLDQLLLIPAQKKLFSTLEDADLRVTARALQAVRHGAGDADGRSDLFERLEKLLSRYPAKPEKLQPIVWPWTATVISKEMVADALPVNLQQRPPTVLIPHLDLMGTYARAMVVTKLAAQKKWDAATRDTLFALLGDASRQVREEALRQLVNCELTPAEAVGIEQLLDRKSGDLRRGSLTLLSRQQDDQVLASADRLLTDKNPPRRLAGLELLRQLSEARRCPAEARRRAEQYSQGHPKLNDAERQQIEVLLAAGAEVPTLDDALGLVNHNDRSWPTPAPAREVRLHSPVAKKIILAVDQLLAANAQQLVSINKDSDDPWTGLLSDLTHGFPEPDPKKSAAEDRSRLPLCDVWEKWWQERGPELRDEDGMEILRALALLNFFGHSYNDPEHKLKLFPEMVEKVFGGESVAESKMQWRAGRVLSWLLKLYPPTADPVDFALNAAAWSLAQVPREALSFQPGEAEEYRRLPLELRNYGSKEWQEKQKRFDAFDARLSWRKPNSAYGVWLSVLKDLDDVLPQFWNTAAHVRHWKLLRWLDEPVRPQEAGGNSGISKACCIPRDRAGITQLCLAHGDGGATVADILEQLLGNREATGFFSRQNFGDLHEVSGRKPRAGLVRFEFLFPLMERCRKRILEVELTRGEHPTAASAPAQSLGSVVGVANLVAILRALGKRNFIRGYASDNQSIETVFSHLVRCCFPEAGETAADFGRQVKAANISEERLVELAVYAPQWAGFVEAMLGWNLLTEAVWWIHAHTKGMDWTVDRHIRELWQADINSRTALSSADLLEGAVDVVWFHRIHDALGAKRWTMLYEAARYASTGGGHARAQLFADAMLDAVSKRELVGRITKKRYQDAVRALGLLPLAEGKKRESDLLDRYKVIQEFRRGSKQFGSQRQASEKRAAQIAQENLARTAGYADPIRLEWAMEARAVEDLADGPIEVLAEGVKVSLGIDAWGEIELNVTKDGKTLADIPAKLKKDKKIAALRARKVELKRQASRIRPSLEQFMVKGDEFTGAELCGLMEHPLLAPMLKNLVITGDGIIGYPVHGGKALENHEGAVEAVKRAEKLRVAHPHDLLPAAAWHKWQKDCFARERIQPFKQVFRELYPLTATEKTEGLQTRRYAGHQVQPRQALALLGQRGWVHHPEEGVRKVFHDAGLVAWLHFQEGFATPAEIEGLTLEGVFFTKRGETKPVRLDQIPPRLFSESMRDLDLVVSVAHRGGVDPEASASTVEMRATLVEETARLLKLKNVRIKDRYALVQGGLGEYSVHLGSAVTRKMPGEALFLVPVHSQHRGRLFLPFADDDPRTAEVMSKVLLLARDTEIKDPNILDQIRS